VDSWQFVQGSGLLKKVHTFLWNRWYINSFYYLVFVDGVISLGRGMYNGLEKLVFDKITPVVSGLSISLGNRLFRSLEMLVFDKITPVVSGLSISLGNRLFRNLETDVIDEGLNVGVPKAATSLYHHVKKLQTGVLSYNIVYMVLMFLVLFVMFILMFGGVI
jgi:hypothetical protein